MPFFFISFLGPFTGKLRLKVRLETGQFYIFEHSKADDMSSSIAEVNITSPQ